MSPEQGQAKRGLVDHRTDIYSLGVTLYELLTLRPAFDGGHRYELLHNIAFGEPRPPRKVVPAVPVELETIVLKANGGRTPPTATSTAQEMADDLRRFLEDRPIRAPAGDAGGPAAQVVAAGTAPSSFRPRSCWRWASSGWSS